MMEFVNKLETKVASWYKNVPHLPANGQKWLADNIWWLALISVILGIIGVFGVFTTIFVVGAVLTGLAGFAGVAIGGIALVVALVTMAFSIVNIIITAFAIAPLKEKRKKGWSLLFLTILISVLSLAVGFLFTFELISLTWGLVLAALMAYFLFEIRHYFNESASVVTIDETSEVIPPANKPE